MQSCKHIYRISLAGRGPQGSLKSNSLFLFLPLSEPPVKLRPASSRGDVWLPLAHPSSFPTHISVALQETLGQGLKEYVCFTVSCSPETHIWGLGACTIPQSSLTLLAWSQG